MILKGSSASARLRRTGRKAGGSRVKHRRSGARSRTLAKHTNPVISRMLRHRSIRRYKARRPSKETVEAVVRAGQAAAYAAQLYSLVLTTDRDRNPFRAPLLFTVCVDLHKMEVIMRRRGWRWASNDLSSLLFGAQDAAYMAQNMILAEESLGLGTCLLGAAPYQAEALAKKLSLPPRVFPLVQLAMGYPAEYPPARPRYPMDFKLFKNRYPRLGPARVRKAMEVMDRGFLKQGYYRKAGLILPLAGGRKEKFTFDGYSWTEHQSRKWGQWNADIRPLLRLLGKRGFILTPGDKRRK